LETVSRFNSLAVRIAAYAVITVLLVSVGFSVTQVYVEFEREVGKDQKAYQEHLNELLPLMHQASQTENEALAERTLQILLTSEIIDAAEILGASGNSLAKITRTDPIPEMPLVHFLVEQRTPEFITLHQDTSAEQAGKLTIWFNVDRGLVDFAERNLFFLGLASARIGMVLLVLLLLIRLQIITPVQRLLAGLEASSESGSDLAIPSGHEKDELGALVAKVNRNFELQRQQLRQIAANEQRFKSILDGAGDACFLFDQATGDIVYANQTACELTGYGLEALLRLSVLDITSSLNEQEWMSRVRFIHSLEAHRRESVIRAADGNEIPVESTSSMIEVEDRPVILSFVRDMRARKQLEYNLAHAQKLTSLGELTSGVSHDFNNLLQLIQGALDVIEADYQDANTVVKKSLGVAKKATDEGGRLVGQLLSFSRKQVLDPEVISVSEIIENNLELLRQAAGRKVRLIFEASEEIDRVMLDNGALVNALLNLVVNANHAMPDGGELKLVIRPPTSEERNAYLPPNLRGQSLICLSVADNGMGMTPDVMNRVFEPFYTTKSDGAGTGMGLASVFGFVAQSDGFIRVESTPGQGSTFYIYLPLSSAETPQKEEILPRGETRSTSSSITEPESDATIAGVASKVAASQRKGGMQTATHLKNPAQLKQILLVETHADLRFISQSFLESVGYRVLAADSLSAALLELSARGTQLSILLTDLALPKTEDGMGLIEFCQTQHPHLKIGILTGIATELARSQFTALPPDNILSKPFNQKDLIEFVTRLDAANTI